MLRERTFIALSIALLGIAAAGALRPPTVDPQARYTQELNRFWIGKTKARGPFDIVLIGDSRTYRGVSPIAMRRILEDYRILNFGYSVGGLNKILFEAAEQRLDTSSAKKTILLGITPMSLTLRAKLNKHYKEQVENVQSDPYRFDALRPIVDFLQPFSLRDMVAPYFSFAVPHRNTTYFNEFHEDGWVGSWQRPERPNSALLSYRKEFEDNQVSKVLIEELLAQTSSWTAKGIRVFAFELPVTKEMKELENELSGLDVTALRSRFIEAGGRWLAVPESNFHSYDGSHLDKHAAVRFSVLLAREIQRLENTAAELSPPTGPK